MMMKYLVTSDANANEHNCDQEQPYYLVWHELSFFQEKLITPNPLFPWKKERQVIEILKPMNGQLKSGTVNAILGPSGSGKTTLLNCITGRTKERKKAKRQGEGGGGGRGGNCFIRSSVKLKCNLKNNFRFGYVPQVDSFFTRFTLRETVTFACKINNSLWTREKQEKEVNSIIDSLDLKDEMYLPLNRLSGGQLKRTSIALELICRPLILVLDEPTSGLDVDNALKLISILKKLTRCIYPSPSALQPIIVLSIHSPSFQLFQLFDQIYLLSKDGCNIFQGPPSSAACYFNSFGFAGMRGNPAEYLIDVASGKFGCEPFQRMALASCQRTHCQPEHGDQSTRTLKRSPSASFSTQTFLLMQRWLVYYFLKVPQAIARACDHLMIFCFLSFFLVEPIAEDAFCREKLGQQAENASSCFDQLIDLRFKLGLSDKVNKFITLGSYCAFILIDVTFAPSIIAILLMTLHMATYKRELGNSWYTCGSFFTSKIITDAIVRIFCLVPASILFIYRSGAPFHFWPIVSVTAAVFVSSTIWENLSTSVTMYIGCKRSKLVDTVAAVFLLQLMDHFFIDFVVPQASASVWAGLLKVLSSQANLYRVVIVSLFGFARCNSPQSSIKFMDIASGPPKDLFRRVWRSCNITQNELAALSDLLDVRENLLGALFSSLDEWLSHDESPHRHSQSRFLDFFSITEHQHESFLRIGVPLTWFLVSFLVLWCTVRRRSRLYQ